jgi:SAM-dependent methyltransferase
MDAETLEFPDASFDRVLCGFGIMFFPNQARALGEMHRVLKPGGRLAVSTWRISQAEEMSAVTAALGLGTGSPPGWINKADKLQQLIESAGFRDVKVSEDAHEFRYAGIDEYWQQARGTGLRATLDKLDAAGAERVRKTLEERVKPGLRDGALYLTSVALLAVATR